VIHPGLLVVGVAAMILRSLGMVRFWRGAFIMGLAVPAAVMVRVIVEVARDSTSHNLWPLEIVIAWVVGSACALAGVMLGSVLRWPRTRGAQR
jgi:cytochrome c oxidase assembly factor CtaG